MKPSLYFHLAMWATIAVVLFFSAPSHAMYWVSNGCETPSRAETLDSWKACYPSHKSIKRHTLGEVGSGTSYGLEIVFTDYSSNYSTWYGRCDDGSFPTHEEAVAELCATDEPPVEPEGTEIPCSGDGNQPSQVCLDGTQYNTFGGSLTLFLDTGDSWAGQCVSTGQSCDGSESALNPDYDLPVLPKTNQSVEINGQEIPLVESGCGEIAGTLTCTNEPNCGEFNGEWVCTGPDNGTPGVPAEPIYQYTASGNVTADRAGDQYFYNSTTVSNSTNLGTGGAGDSTDPTDPGDPEPRTDGSDSGDANAPLGQGSCPAGYVQTGVTALGDGSTEAQCAPDGGTPDWMGWFNKLNMADELPSDWLQLPEIPGTGGPSSACPAPTDFQFFGASFEISYSPFCDLASTLRPFLILIGYLVAGWFVFRIIGGGDK